MTIALNISLLEDCFIFPILQFLFLMSSVVVFIYDRGWLRQARGIVAEVKRGAESWGYFHTVYGFLSIIFLEMINTTEAFKNYKTIVTVIDLGVLMYLCFFSSWFRSKIVGIVSKSKEMIEK